MTHTVDCIAEVRAMPGVTIGFTDLAFKTCPGGHELGENEVGDVIGWWLGGSPRPRWPWKLKPTQRSVHASTADLPPAVTHLVGNGLETV